MNYDAGTGEFLPQIDLNFKIPLKANNKKSDTNATNEVKSELYTSPLALQDSVNDDLVAFYDSSHSVEACTQQRDEETKLLTKRKASEIDLSLKEGLPYDLTKLLLPLSCELCTVKMNSSLSAKLHYESKQHDKKVNTWLLDWSKKTGEPMPKRERRANGPAGPNAFHCEYCDLSLTSLQHANQHYMGKKHRLVVAGKMNPNGSGYYGPDGKWIRTNMKPTSDPTGRFNIGKGFQQPPVNAADVIKSEINVNTEDPERFCKVCNVCVTSAPQMKLHLEGSRHAKKLRLLGEPPHAPKDDTILYSLDKNPKTSSVKRDNSIYRTPSGSYYCKPCNVTIITEVLFNQHMDSKKHIKNVKVLLP